MIPIQFSKYHGTGNDFILLDNRDGQIHLTESDVAALCHRHFGIGGDGLMLAEPSDRALIKMVYYNGDGSPAVMCGNGIRCFAKFLWDKKIVLTEEFDVETAAGVKRIRLTEHADPRTSRVRVDMGPPIYETERIGVTLNAFPVVDQKLDTPLGEVVFSALSMGNPHAVIQVEDVDRFPIREWGPLVEKHEIFPQGANVNFTQLVDRTHCKVITWERGAGQTMACGTGSCAAAALLHKKGLVDNRLEVQVPGGVLDIEVGETIIMTGPAVWVFDGWTEETEEEPQ